MKLRLLVPIFLVCCLLAAPLMSTRTHAAQPASISVYINSVKQQVPIEPFIKNNTVLVPLRFVMNSLQAKVTYSASLKNIVIQLDDTNITLFTNDQHAIVNGQQIKLTQPPILVNNHTFVPLRFISETLGATVDWDQQTKTVAITFLPLATQFMMYDAIMTESYDRYEAILEANPHFANKAAEIVAMENPSVNYSYLKLAFDYGADPIIPLKIALRFEHQDLLYYLLNKGYVQADGTLFNGGYTVFGFFSPEEQRNTTLMVDEIPYQIDYRDIQNTQSHLYPMLVEFGFEPNANDVAVQLISNSKHSLDSMQLLLEHNIDVNSSIGKTTAFSDEQELQFITLEEAMANNRTTSLIELAAELAFFYKNELYLNKLNLLITNYDANINKLSTDVLQPLGDLAKQFKLSELEALLHNELSTRA